MTQDTIYIDGGCSGNPGPMRVALVHGDLQKVIERGIGTNNIAEYQSLILALIYVKKIFPKLPNFYEIRSDSKLVVEQVNGRWKCKDPILQRHLRTVQQRIIALQETYGNCISVTWIPRERNRAGKLLE
jgi:ribonuclease HI